MNTQETTDGQAVRSSPLLERLRVRWSNWKNRRVAKAYRTMATALQRDPAYACSWHANIAITIRECAGGKLTHAESCKIADRLMSHLWGVSSNTMLDRQEGAR